MEFLTLPYLTAGIAALLGGAFVAFHSTTVDRARTVAAVAGLIALALFGAAAYEVSEAGHARLFDPVLSWLEADALDAVPMAFFGVLTLVYVMLSPRRDADGSALSGLLIVSAGTQISYASSNFLLLALGWWITCLPFLIDMFVAGVMQRPVRYLLVLSCSILTVAAILLGMEHAVPVHANLLVFCMLILAVVLRKGIFPLHGWVVSSFEHGPLLPTALLFNGHLGALLLARAEVIGLPPMAERVLNVLCGFAILTALIASVRAFVERNPRRLLAFICVSQASFILAGLTTTNTEGITGSLVHWLVVSVASTGLVCVLRALEVRVYTAMDPPDHLGLAVRAPRLATFFLLCGLAMIGLPGTLGYCGEDLLFHGALEHSPYIGIALLAATAFNAINLMRLYGQLFLGVLPKHVAEVPDALPRERWGLILCVLFLVVGGLIPRAPIGWREPAAEEISTATGGPAAHVLGSSRSDPLNQR